MYILLIKDNCERCDWVKKHIPDGLNIRFIDAKSVDGMSYLAYYEKYDEKTTFPVFITGEEAIEGTIEIRKKMQEIKENNKRMV